MVMIKAVCEAIKKCLDVECVQAHSLKECKEAIECCQFEFVIALTDINLPDAPDGEVVDYVISKGISPIVMTAMYDESLREQMEQKDIIDYVLKEGQTSVIHIVSIIKRVLLNKKTKALVVDDSKSFRAYISYLLKRQQLIVLEAQDGQEALAVFEKNPDIKIVLTDYIMPKMDGIDLTKELRRAHNKDTLAIIVMSGQDDKRISSMFLKLGANDFLYKPFSNEEFNTRVNSNLELLELFRHTKDLAERDFLTGIYNRRYFFEIGKKILSSAKRKNTQLAVAMIDIDYFKKINDTYGHDVGDIAIKDCARMITSSFRDTDVCARIGGEEFAVLLVDCNPSKLFDIIDELRGEIEAHAITIKDGVDLKFTISIGVCPSIKENLEEMIVLSDKMLYEAKNSGRNRVKIGS